MYGPRRLIFSSLLSRFNYFPFSAAFYKHVLIKNYEFPAGEGRREAINSQT